MEAGDRPRDEGGEAGAVVLAAHRAVAMNHGAERPLQFVGQRTTKASSLGHGPPSRAAGGGRTMQG